MSLSKAQLTEWRKLKKPSYRKARGLFIAEGWKCISELLPYFELKQLVLREELEEQLPLLPQDSKVSLIAEDYDLSQISLLKTPQDSIALFRTPPEERLAAPKEGLSLLLDEVQDPGNLGTIIRTADWFDLKDLYLTKGTVDPYSPKVVQATMGSLGRVRIHRVKELEALESWNDVSLMGAFLDGEPINQLHREQLPKKLVLCMGNEGNGISPALSEIISERVTIPRPEGQTAGPESLNVAIATAIILGQLKL